MLESIGSADCAHCLPLSSEAHLSITLIGTNQSGAMMLWQFPMLCALCVGGFMACGGLHNRLDWLNHWLDFIGMHPGSLLVELVVLMIGYFGGVMNATPEVPEAPARPPTATPEVPEAPARPPTISVFLYPSGTKVHRTRDCKGPRSVEYEIAVALVDRAHFSWCKSCAHATNA